jgi:dienelactone hydrolase
MALGGYAEDAFTWEGSTRRVFRRGSGPAVLVIHEVPGITPAVLAFADRVADLGCTAVLPSLLGKPAGGARDPRHLASALARLCISREFNYFAFARPRRSLNGCARWVAMSTSAAVGRGSGSSACASAGGLRWR